MQEKTKQILKQNNKAFLKVPLSSFVLTGESECVTGSDEKCKLSNEIREWSLEL